jgi:hypothetical protein
MTTEHGKTPPIPRLDPETGLKPRLKPEREEEPEKPPPVVLGSRPEPADPKAKPTFLTLFRQASTGEEWSDPVREWGHENPHNLHTLHAMKKLGEYSKDWGALFTLIKETLKEMGVKSD